MSKKRLLAFCLPYLFLLSGCVAIEVAREVHSGRRDLRKGNPRAAVARFEAAGRLEPDYITRFTPLKIGIWSYAGRAYYEAGDKARALESFKRARAQHSHDYFAQIYLGTLMALNGRRAEGARELETGLRALHQWVEEIPGRTMDGRYWDPGGDLRGRIQQTLALLRAEQVNWSEVEKNVLWLGEKFDEEIDLVREHRQRDMEGTPLGEKP